MPEIDTPPAGSDVPAWTLLFRVQLQVAYEQAFQLEGPPAGTRSLYPILGGEFHGEHLRGIVEPGGADFPSWRSDGSMLVDARIMLRTDDHELIYMTYTGISYIDLDRIEEVRQFDPATAAENSDVYGRTRPVFETGAETYSWLNHTVAIAKGRRTERGPLYSVYGMDVDVTRGRNADTAADGGAGPSA